MSFLQHGRWFSDGDEQWLYGRRRRKYPRFRATSSLDMTEQVERGGVKLSRMLDGHLLSTCNILGRKFESEVPSEGGQTWPE